MPTHTIPSLLTEVSSIVKHHKELSRVSGEDFNIFKITKIQEDETRHSALIAELLNPKGSHGQGHVFLELFLKKLGFENFKYENAEVKTEFYIGHVTSETGGLIDIYITDNNGIKIAIENKINALDQTRQLIRYHNYCGKNLFYLTLYGNEPSTSSCKNEVIELKCEEDYRLLSYKSDILEWLEECKKEATSLPLLREGIAHYINIIKRLTGQSNSIAMKREIIETLVKNPQTLAAANSIKNNWADVKIQIQWSFWKALKSEIEIFGFTLINDPKTVNEEMVKSYYRKKRNKPVKFGYWSKIFEKDEITIHWGCEVNHRFYHGFTIERNGKGHISNELENKMYRNLVLQANPQYIIESKGWLGYKFSEPELDFLNFNSEAIFQLADSASLKIVVEDIVKDAKNDIDFILKNLPQI